MKQKLKKIENYFLNEVFKFMNYILCYLTFSANRHEVHLLIDEIYALSLLSQETKFVSCLSLKLPDPDRSHFLWGFSKVNL